jgi:multiple sugar transport system permease protein
MVQTKTISKKHLLIRWLSIIIEPYLYLSPAIILTAVTIFIPIVIGITYGFRNIELLNPFDTGFVGLKHYYEMIGDRHFWGSLTNTLRWTFYSLFFQFFLGLILALLLSRPFYGQKIIQPLVFVPWAVPTFLSGLNWAWLFNPVIGPLPHWLYAVGILSEPYNILSNPDIALWGPIIANIWFGIPFFAITLLAALQSIPTELYEAASIDGASAWQRFLNITLPFLAPTIAITLLLRTIWIANFADIIVVMTGGGPANTTQTVATYVFTTAYRKLDFGYASAIATVMLVLLLIYTAIVLKIRKSLQSYH